MNFFSTGDLAATGNSVLGRDVAADMQVGLRPEHLVQTDSAGAVVEGTLELVENLGEYALVHLMTESKVEFIAKTERPPEVAKGTKLSFAVKPGLAHYFNTESGARLD